MLAGGRPGHGIDEARATLAVIDAAYRSVEVGDVVAVEHRTVHEGTRV